METGDQQLDQAATSQILKDIEPLEGEVCPQFIRCGKTGCRCQYGRLHGPYHYRIWREGIRVRKVYVKATEVDAVRAACTLHRNLARSLYETRQAKLLLTQSIHREWRRTEQLRNKALSSQ